MVLRMSAITFVTADTPFTDSGNTAWVLAAAALVLFMTPGLALFYGGMVRTKSVLNMMMMSFITMGTVGTVWILWGYSETFGPDLGGGLLGNPFTHFGLKGVLDQIYGYVPADAAAGTAAAGGIPAPAFVAFQVVFAIIAVALVSGAIADRAKFTAWTVFTVVWSTARLLPRRPLGVRVQRLRRGDGRLDRQQGGRAALRRRRCLRLRGWNRDPHQRRCCRPRPGDRAGQAHRVRQGADASPQPDARHDRCRHPVVRLVRLQRRFRPRRRNAGRRRLGQHARRHVHRHARLAGRGEDP